MTLKRQFYGRSTGRFNKLAQVSTIYLRINPLPLMGAGDEVNTFLTG